MNPLREACVHGRYELHHYHLLKPLPVVCPGGGAVTAYPMIVMGGLTPAWYPAGGEEPDGWLVEANR